MRYLFIFSFLIFALSAFGQLKSEADVTLTMDMQPILQLLNQSPSQLSFSFNSIQDYQAGVTLYGATTLKVNATVNWDLYVLGTSSGNVGPAYWDQQIKYGQNATNAVNKIPLSALEVRQSTPNQHAGAAVGVYADYSSPFPSLSTPSGSNSIYTSPAGLPPGPMHKYIAGHSGSTGSNDGVAGGSYLTAGNVRSDFYYVMDYRIVPGLPAIFPMAFDPTGNVAENITAQNGPGTYAQPGIYTMNVEYILVEDQ